MVMIRRDSKLQAAGFACLEKVVPENLSLVGMKAILQPISPPTLHNPVPADPVNVQIAIQPAIAASTSKYKEKHLVKGGSKYVIHAVIHSINVEPVKRPCPVGLVVRVIPIENIV